MQKLKDNSEAVAAFVAKTVEIDTMLARLSALSVDHFNVNPEQINWGNVGTLGFYAAQLKNITDSAFHEGEYAE